MILGSLPWYWRCIYPVPPSFFVYQLCGKRKPWWLIMGTAITTMVLLISPVWGVFVLVFRQILPGNISDLTTGTNFFRLLVGNFFGAGMAEELLKSLPVFVALFLGRQLRSPSRERLGVWEPLDGILLGAASAVGFTLLETLGQYVPDAVESSSQLAGLQLLIPRIIGAVAGHLAYSGYFGYFIGLSVLIPSQRWLILAVGYLTAAALHAFWNATASVSLGIFISPVIGAISYAFLSAAILKARSLSPTRSQNFATRIRL
ncbi:PrsW family intramembrane metalloprotease [Neosynechococcus sphagnicola]|uniref:PrsW family intramembrane metalloprotease n=1 Tax=Neosynechococcus sphagnicola TaxID=1501145 RepID=UPI001EF9EB4B|nr:PrsW family intramembrane metalloprotease [Neosynechococcus sphagnicola]